MRNLLEFLRYPFAAALFMVLAFPRFDLWPLAWVALVPLLLHISRCRLVRQAFLSGFLTGFLFFFGLLYWIPRAMVSYGSVVPWFAWVVLSLICAILGLFFGGFAAVMFRFFQRWSWRAFLLTPLVWVVQELARDHLALTGFPWGMLGTSQAYFSALIQIADLTGVYGVSFLIAAVNSVLFLALSREAPRKLKIYWAALVGMGLLYVLVYAELRFLTYPANKGPELAVAGIQGNIREEDGAVQITRTHLQDYPALLDGLMAAHPGTQLVILPESPATLSWERHTDYRERLVRMAAGHRVTLMWNGLHYLGPGRYCNSVYTLNPAGKLTSVYDKVRLVPFAEYIPFARIFFFASSFSRDISDFQPGAAPVQHDVAGHPVGAFICYEAVFPEFVRSFTDQGAELLVNVTNDGWFGRTAAPWQHVQHVILRAVENRRWLVRVANSGMSAIIDPLGRVTLTAPMFEQAVLAGTVHLQQHRSMYVEIGDAFAYACVLITLLFLIFTWKRKDNHGPGLGGSEEPAGRDADPHP